MKNWSRRLFAVVVAAVLVMSMPCNVFAASRQADFSYQDETFTVYLSCSPDYATANMRTICRTIPVSVEMITYSEDGYVCYSHDINQPSEATTSQEPVEGDAFISAEADYYVNGYISGSEIYGFTVNAS